jgi:hypothetical protein
MTTMLCNNSGTGASAAMARNDRLRLASWYISVRMCRPILYQSGIIHIIFGCGGLATLMHCCREGYESYPSGRPKDR